MASAAIAKNSFNRKSTAEDVTAGVDLSGKTVLITGVASGLGLESMRVLAMRGARVIGIDRSMDATQTACGSIGSDVTPLACDLADPASIVACSDAINTQFDNIDVVLTNAGVMAPPETVVDHYKEPLELQFAVNFIGHFLLINRILPLLQAAPSARIALVASEGYQAAPKEGIKFDDLDFSEGYDALTAYGHSKLAVMLFNIALAKRLEGTNITSNAIHPGVIRTNLASDTKNFKVKLISLLAGPWTRSVPQGAATHCFVAAHPSLEGVSGEHFADSNHKPAGGNAANAEMAEKLWAKAEELAGDFLVRRNMA